jgi:hypothetical protein
MRYLRVNTLVACALLGTWGCSEGGSSGLETSVKSLPLITCHAGPDCDVKWARAGRWVTESSGLKIQTKAESLITTVQSNVDSRTLVLTVTKNPTSQPGIYQISITAGCPNIFSCLPSVSDSRVRLTNFIMAGE